jgi:hypothetical protein
VGDEDISTSGRPQRESSTKGLKNLNVKRWEDEGLENLNVSILKRYEDGKMRASEKGRRKNGGRRGFRVSSRLQRAVVANLNVSILKRWWSEEERFFVCLCGMTVPNKLYHTF